MKTGYEGLTDQQLKTKLDELGWALMNITDRTQYEALRYQLSGVRIVVYQRERTEYEKEHC